MQHKLVSADSACKELVRDTAHMILHEAWQMALQNNREHGKPEQIEATLLELQHRGNLKVGRQH